MGVSARMPVLFFRVFFFLCCFMFPLLFLEVGLLGGFFY